MALRNLLTRDFDMKNLEDSLHNRLRKTAVILLVASLALVGCSRPPELIGVTNPSIPVSSVPDISKHRVFIVTTRGASSEEGAFLSSTRAPRLGLASLEVTVPPNHVVGNLERARRLPPDPRTEFTVINPALYGSERDFIAGLNRELALRPVEERTLLLFIHGFNNSTSDATLRLGQFIEDTGFKGVPILFTWASAARSTRYVYDLNSALIARGKVREIADIMTRTNAQRADVFAHSMGNLLLMEGLVDLQQAGILGRRKEINHIMLASPDIDIDLFRTQLAQLSPAMRAKMFVFASKNDGALRLSSRIAGGVPRVGAANAEELEKLGVTVIDLSDVDDSSAGNHAKFAGSPEVVRLIGAGLNSVSSLDQDSTPAIQQILAASPIRIFRN